MKFPNKLLPLADAKPTLSLRPGLAGHPSAPIASLVRHCHCWAIVWYFCALVVGGQSLRLWFAGRCYRMGLLQRFSQFPEREHPGYPYRQHVRRSHSLEHGHRYWTFGRHLRRPGQHHRLLGTTIIFKRLNSGHLTYHYLGPCLLPSRLF